ncbi:alpha/beta fold hydrolase [Oceanicola sp. 502str15]|uniref:alpha/beta fold hydrolase n=1 Tax=Oceanicola sp. 502str15 TaxID=2696061 RepID=UPI0020947CEA|nr:alpha/beta fold hydrolase [Oceanicola sp. 502str15]MCO6383495.1 alpha/beta fold hydrolase [Oceanicola sp. 502str15]
MRALLALPLLLAACAAPPTLPVGESPLATNPARSARAAEAPRLTVMIPGALASVDIFAPTNGWAARGHALAYYRFPGMDGLELDHQLSITAAAEEIARYARQHPDKQLTLVGYSAGGAIALEAAALLAPRPVTVAAISPSPEHAGGLQTILRGAGDVISAATRAGSFTRKAIWDEYWKTLLYGRNNRDNPRFTNQIETLSKEHAPRIADPSPALVRAHSSGLRRWELSEGADLSHARIGFFIGMEDPVFSTRQTDTLRRRAGGGRLIGFADDGHLLLLTRKSLFDHVLRFVEADG